MPSGVQTGSPAAKGRPPCWYGPCETWRGVPPSAGGGGLGQHAFAYAMALLVLVAIFGSVLVYRGVSQESRLSQLRTDFVSAVSHEFRSPLSSILALSERLESARVHDPGQLAQYHQMIGQEAQLRGQVRGVSLQPAEQSHGANR